MNQIEIFNSPEFGSIRTLEQNGKVLFCGTDVATALGYTNPRKAVRDHTRGGTKCSIGVQTGKKADGSPAVQMVEMLFIPEGDLYRLIAHEKISNHLRRPAMELQSIFQERIGTQCRKSLSDHEYRGYLCAASRQLGG